MTLDPEVQAWLKQLAAAALPPLDSLSVEEAREQMRASSEPLETGETVDRTENREAPGPAGPIPLRIYDPGGAGPKPAIVYFHGGGWVLGSIETHDHYCRCLANASGMLVVSVEYRLAPEHPYPAAVDDCYAATKWVSEQAAELGADAARICVAGDSAGGNLAAAVALKARDEEAPKLAFQVLIYPILDHNFDTDSYLRNMEGFHLTRDAMIWFWDLYVPDNARRGEDYASPLRADNLEDLPPALVITAEYDPLSDEGEAFVKRLQAAETPVELVPYPGTIHGFARRTKLWQHARDCLQEVGEKLREALAAQ